MYNMFEVALAPFKSHCYFLLIYHVKNISQVNPNWPIFRNRDIVYADICS